MKQTQTWSLAGEEAVSYSLARGKAAAVTRESGEIAAYSLAPWREQSLALDLGRAAGRDRGKTPKPLLSCLSRPSLAPSLDIYRYRAWGARPEDHVIINAPEGIIIIHKIFITLYTLYYYKVR